MWSASSMTVTKTSLRSSRPCSMRSSTRPGVAMTMSTPRCSADDLTVLRHAADDRDGEQADAAGDGLHGAVDLHGELAGRGEDQRAGLAALLAVLGAVVLHEPLDERCAEGDGLAGAGLAAAEDILAGEHVGDGRGLDRERQGRAHGGELAGDVVADAELGEGAAVGLGRGEHLGLEALEDDVLVRGEAALWSRFG